MRPPLRKRRATARSYPTYFAFGAIGLHLVFIVIPSIMGIYYSLTNWSRFSSDNEFVGLDNYRTVFSSDGAMFLAVKNTVLFTVFTIVTKTVIGLMLALLVSRGIRRFSTFHRAVIYLPAVLPMIVVGIVFKSILNPSTGILNRFLDVVGLDFLTARWLTDTRLALYSIVAVDTWKGVGFIMLLLLAGLESIPREYSEAARIDGANAFTELRYITLPLLKPILLVTTVSEPALRIEDLRQRLGIDQWRTRLRNRDGEHHRVQRVRARSLRRERSTLDGVVHRHDHVWVVPHPGNAQTDRRCLSTAAAPALRAGPPTCGVRCAAARTTPSPGR